jgi:hypothetical protein
MSHPYLKPTAAAVDDMDRRRRGLPWMWMLVDDLDGFSASCPRDVDRRRVGRAWIAAGVVSPGCGCSSMI